ncbi:MAG: hydroxyisourate hydrolase [Parvularculaceae bacterium]
MAGLTTHVLDIAHGRPARGVEIALFRETDAGAFEEIAHAVTNADGRCDGLLLSREAMETGRYRLDFHAGAYFRACGVELPEPAFLDVVSIAFGIADVDAHYHVPLLISPYGYSTYRGS